MTLPVMVNDLPPYPGTNGPRRGDIVGFAFKGGMRYKRGYASHKHRARIECWQLCDHGLWEEAWEKYGEYSELCLSNQDVKLYARVMTGRSKARRHMGGRVDKSKVLEQGLEAIRFSVPRDDDSNCGEIVGKIVGIVEEYEKQLIPRRNWKGAIPDFESEGVSIKKVIDVAEAWIFVHSIFFDQGDDRDVPQDRLYCIIESLGRREAYKEARMVVRKILKVGIPSWCSYYQTLNAECAEAMGDMKGACAAYGTISQADNLYDKYEASSIIGNKLCPAGTLSERMHRTRCAA